MKEAGHNTQLNKYLRDQRAKGFYCYYELKKTGGQIFYVDAFESHQLSSLVASENEGLVWKLSDQDQRKKPFDGFSTPPLPSYVIIKYPKAFLFFRVKAFLEIRDRITDGGKHVLEYAEALELAERILYPA
jgi:hypothetical protein